MTIQTVTMNESKYYNERPDPIHSVLEDCDQQEVMIALRRITQAFGGVPKLAEQADLNATTLYRTLSPQGNPEMKTLTAILKALGLRLAVLPIKTGHA